MTAANLRSMACSTALAMGADEPLPTPSVDTVARGAVAMTAAVMPLLIRPGERVTFRPVTAAEFERLAALAQRGEIVAEAEA